jgi:transposase InsO family protein
VYAWIRRYEAGGLDALADRSRRPHSSPKRLAAEIEAMICQLRQAYSRWGARRIAHELAVRGVAPSPSRSTVYRVLVRNGLIRHQEQHHRRTYRRWQRDAPMQLWQLDIMSGVFLAGGRECKLVTGIDDHSRFVVIAQVVAEPSGRAVCTAFAEAMARYGVPSEVLTDNGKQFTGRYTKPLPAEVLFERICRENGITARLTKPRTPTTTGKIERLHKTLRRELLDHCGPFADQSAAQVAIDAWVHAYNHARPHQSLDMATPATVFRPAPPTATLAWDGPSLQQEPLTAALPPRLPTELPAARTLSEHDVHAVEWEMLVSPAGRLILPGGQHLKFSTAMAGRTVTLWANDRTIHVLLDGHLIRTSPSRFSAPDLVNLLMRGGRIAGPEPGPAAVPPGPLPPTIVVEIDRIANSNARIEIGGQRVTLAAHLASQQVTLRLDGRLMHVIAAGLLVQTLPASVPIDRRAKLAGARTASSPLPPPPSQPPRAMRRVPADGVTMVAGQRLSVGRSHAGKTITIVIEDTVFRVLHGDIELSTHARTSDKPVTRYKAHARRTSLAAPSLASPEPVRPVQKPSSMS